MLLPCPRATVPWGSVILQMSLRPRPVALTLFLHFTLHGAPMNEQGLLVHQNSTATRMNPSLAGNSTRSGSNTARIPVLATVSKGPTSTFPLIDASVCQHF
jgi:hypothetical protein